MNRFHTVGRILCGFTLCLLLALTGCGGSQPQIFSANFVLIPAGASIRVGAATRNADTVIDEVGSGATSIATIIGSYDTFTALNGTTLPDTRCNFTASFADERATGLEPDRRPRPTYNGSLGQLGYNIEVRSSNPQSLTTDNPASCPQVTGMNLSLGGPQTTLNVGDTTDDGNITMAFDDGRDFTANTSRFFRATLNQHTTGPRRRAASFSFINRLAGQGDVLIGEGSFAITDF